MKSVLRKIKKSSFLIPFVCLAAILLLYQCRIYIGGSIWQLRDINNYMITVQTQEEFGSSNKVAITCLYILAVQNEEIEIADISCENNVKQKSTYLGKEMTASGLINLAKGFQSDKPFLNIASKDYDASINWLYGFPNRLVYEKSDDDYRVIITVEDFKVY